MIASRENFDIISTKSTSSAVAAVEGRRSRPWYATAVGTLVYSGGGDPKLPKERLEAFGGGVSAVLDDFRVLEVFRGGKRSTSKSAQDKGRRAEIKRFLDAVQGTAEPPPAVSYLDSTRLTLALAESLRTGQAVDTRAPVR